MTYPLLKEMIQAVVGGLLKEQVRRKMNIPLPEDLLAISDLFKRAGRQFYLVGGSVRDALLGKQPKDLDIATDAHPDMVEKILQQNPAYKILKVGESFGVIKVITPEGNEYEIATFRQESYVQGETKEDFVKFIKGKGPQYEERLRVFLDMSKNL